MEFKSKHSPFFSLLLLLVPLVFLVGCGTKGDNGAAGATGATGATGAGATTTSAALTGSFNTNILPLFTKNDQFFPGSMACSTCHFSTSTSSLHELGLGSYTAIITGIDSVSVPANRKDLLGRDATCLSPFTPTATGACTPVWADSELTTHLRNTRMPPGWTFDLGEANRDTPEIKAIQGWITDGALQTEVAGTSGKIGYNTPLSNIKADGAGNYHLAAVTAATSTISGWQATPLSLTIGDLFKQPSVFFPGSQACTDCHGGLGYAWHELNMGTYAGILTGPDASTGGEDMLGRAAGCALNTVSVTGCAPNWDKAALKRRLRNTRMPPGWPFQLDGTNRDDDLTQNLTNNAAIKTLKAWVNKFAPNGNY